MVAPPKPGTACTDCAADGTTGLITDTNRQPSRWSAPWPTLTAFTQTACSPSAALIRPEKPWAEPKPGCFAETSVRVPLAASEATWVPSRRTLTVMGALVSGSIAQPLRVMPGVVRTRAAFSNAPNGLKFNARVLHTGAELPEP